MTEQLAGLNETVLADNQLTFDQADALFKGGVIGTKEYRSWLADRYSDFRGVRDGDVDRDIVALATLRQKRLEEEAQAAALS